MMNLRVHNLPFTRLEPVVGASMSSATGLLSFLDTQRNNFSSLHVKDLKLTFNQS